MAVFDMFFSREEDTDLLQHVSSWIISKARVQILQSFEFKRANA